MTPIKLFCSCLFLFGALLPSFAQLDETWTVTVNGQTVRVNPDGSFRIPNIAAPDQFGPDGPGSAPDFLSDDPVRLIGVKNDGENTRYVFSEPFQIQQGETYFVGDLTFTDTPPPQPASLSIETPGVTIPEGGSMQLSVIGRLNDGSLQDLTLRTSWTIYRTSNRRIAVVDRDGLISARRAGTVFITAVNEGAVAVKRLFVGAESIETTVEGLVRLPNDDFAPGALVTTNLGNNGTTDTTGFFSILQGVPVGQPLYLAVAASVDGVDYYAHAGPLAVTEDGITDAGFITLIEGRDSDGDGIPDEVENDHFSLDPNDPDSDNDGIPDGEEDTDGDGLTNLVELTNGLDPLLADTDGDDINDGQEDADMDGLDNASEILAGTLINNPDSDGDGMNDGYEVQYGLDPNNLGDVFLDPDNDGLTNIEEANLGTDPFNPDITAPTVEITYPDLDATAIPLDHAVVVRFDEKIRPGTGNLTVNDGSEAAVNGFVTISGDARSLVFRPTDVWLASHTYSLQISDVRDVAGNLLPTPFSSSFTTGGATDEEVPYLILTRPQNNQLDVPANLAFSATFSKRMDPSTLTPERIDLVDNVLGQPVPFSLDISADGSRVSLVPDRPLALNHQHYFRARRLEIRDIAGNPYNTHEYIYFTTDRRSDDDGPLLSMRTPTGIGVPRNAPVQLRFDESIFPPSLEHGFQLSDGSSQVPGAFTFSEGNRVVTFTPSEPFAANTTFTVTLGTGIVNLVGLPLQDPGSFSFSTGATVDDERPFHLTVSPADNASVPVNTRAWATFNEPLSPISVNSDTFHIRNNNYFGPIAGTTELSEDGLTVTFTPDLPLQPGAAYRLVQSGLTDLAGNTVSSNLYLNYFTVEGNSDTQPPVVLAISPQDGLANVPVNTQVSVRFDEPINGASIDANNFRLDGVSGSLHIDESATRVTLLPEAPLAPNTNYSLTLENISDLAGNTMGAVNASFTTGGGTLDETGPQVVNVSPANEASDVAVGTPVVLNLDEAIDPTTVNEDSITIRVSGQSGVVAGSFSVSGSTITFTPAPVDPRLPPGGSTIEIRLSANVTDLAGNPATPFSSRYHTGADNDTQGPFVIAHTPAMDADAVLPGQSVYLRFSESLLPSSVSTTTIHAFADGELENINLSMNLDNTVVTVRGSFGEHRTITVLVTAGVTDFAGNEAQLFELAFQTGEYPDNSRPFIVEQFPYSYGIPTTLSAISWRVSAPLDPSTLSDAVLVNENGLRKQGTVTSGADGQLIVFNPTTPFAVGSLITTFISDDARDSFGNQLIPFQSDIRLPDDPTPNRPTLIDITRLTSEQPTNPVFHLRYDQPLDPFTVDSEIFSLNASGLQAIDVVLLPGGRIIRIAPLLPLPPETSGRLSLDWNSLFDLDGQSANGFSYNFNTTANQDIQAPHLTHVSPPADALDVGANVPIRLRFDESIDRVTFLQSMRISSGSNPLSGLTYNFGYEDRDVTIHSSQGLSDNTRYTVSLNGVTDLAGNPLEPYSSTFTTGSRMDTRRPQSLAISPQSGAANVPIDVVPEVVFDEGMDPVSLDLGFRLYDDDFNQYISGVVIVSPDATQARFVPDEPLPMGHRIRLYLSNLSDLAGNTYSGNNSVYFTTAFEGDSQPPSLVATLPVDGALQVPLNVRLSVIFDEPLAASSIENIQLLHEGLPVAIAVGLTEDGHGLFIHPLALLAPDTTYQLRVEEVSDRSGNLSADDVSVTFTTSDSVDLTRPLLVASDPAPNTVNVPTNARFALGFDEPIEPGSVRIDNVYLYNQNNNFRPPIDLLLSEDRRVIQVVPRIPLDPFADYSMNYRYLSDGAGNQVNGNGISFDTGAGPTDTAPNILAVTVEDGLSVFPINGRLRMKFDQPIATLSSGPEAFTLLQGDQSVSGSVSWSDFNRLVTFTPDAPLTADSAYAFFANGLVGLANNPLIGYAVSFSTSSATAPDGGSPNVIDMFPAHGSTEIGRDEPIVLTFNEVVDPTSVDEDSIRVYVSGFNGNVAGDFTTEGNTVTFTPRPDLNRYPPGVQTIQVRVDSDLLDLAGNNASYFSGSFQTADNPDGQSPHVVDMSPVDGSLEVPISSVVTLFFSESIDPATLDANSLALFHGGEELYSSRLITSDNRSVSLRASLPEGALIQVFASADILDMGGNPLVPFTASFTTTSDNLLGPAVVDQRPSNGSTNVVPEAPITLFLNKPMDPATLENAMIVTEEGTAKAGQLSLSGGNQLLIFTPDSPYSPNSRIRVFFTGSATDLAGHPGSPYEGSVRVEAETIDPRFRVTSYFGASDDTPRNAVFDLVFSRPFAAGSVSSETVQLRLDDTPLAVSFVTRGERVLRIVPHHPLQADTYYNLYLPSGGVTDTNGEGIEDFYRYFQTGLEIDSLAPTIELTSPLPNQARVPQAAFVHARFDERINPLTVDPTRCGIRQNGAFLPATLAFDSSYGELAFNPHQPLIAGTTYDFVLQSIQDLAGHPIAPFSASFTVSEDIGITRPRIVFTSPIDNAEDVPINTVIRFRVDRPLDPIEVEQHFRLSDGQTIPGSFQFEDHATLITFVPDGPLAAGRDHTVSLSSSMIGQAGNQIYGESVRFTTSIIEDDEGPRVSSTSPVDGWNDVAINAQMAVRFDEPIDPESARNISLSGDGSTVPVSRQFSEGNLRVVLVPELALSPFTTYQLSIEGIVDQSGNVMANPRVISFTTSDAIDLHDPAIIWVSPESSSNDVATNTVVTVWFSERIDPTYLTPDRLRLTLSGQSVPVSLEVDPAGRSITLVPIQPLLSETRYYVRFSGLPDLVGQTTSGYDRSFDTGVEQDSEAPSLIASNPPDGQAEVPVNTSLRFRFSEPIVPSSVYSGLQFEADGVAVPGTLTFDDDRTHVTFAPDESLLPNVSYSWNLLGLLDRSRNQAPDLNGTFQTTNSSEQDTTRPRIIAVSPQDEATDINLNSQIIFTFDEDIDPTSVDAEAVRVSSSGAVFPGILSANADTVVYTPLLPYPTNSVINVSVNTGLVDIAGNRAYSFHSSFTTGATLDTTPPTVISVTPADGAVDVRPDSRVTLTFSESLDAGTLRSNRLSLLVDGQPLYSNITRTADNRTVRLDASLPENAVVSVLATPGVTDLAGNPLVNFSSSFGTTSQLDATRPRVSRFSPDTYDAPPETPITVFFNEPMDASTLENAFFVTQNGNLVSGTVQVLGNGLTLVFRPAVALEYDALVELSLSDSALDQSGNTLYPFNDSFRVSDDPELEAPDLLGYAPSGSNIPTNSVFLLRYSESLDPTTVDSTTVRLLDNAGDPVASNVTLEDNDQTIRVAPDADLQSGQTYRLRIDSNSVFDLDGMAASYLNTQVTTGDSPDESAPVVTLVSPPDGAVDTDIMPVLRIRFDQPINPLAVYGGLRLETSGSPVPLPTYSFTNDNRDVLLSFNAPLHENTAYEWIVDGLMDEAGNTVKTMVSRFTTGSTRDIVRPEVVAFDPQDNSDLVPLSSAIRFRTDEPLEPGTIDDSSFSVYGRGGKVPATIMIDSDGLGAALIPDVPLEAGYEHDVYISSEIQDLAGNELIPRYFDFTTGFTEDDTAPSVMAMSPANGMTGIPINARILLALDEPVRTTRVQQVVLEYSGNSLPVHITGRDAGRFLTIQPRTLLPPNASLTLTVSGLEDLSGNVMVGSFSSSFDTGPDGVLTEPFITWYEPLNYSEEIPLNARTRMRFSHPIDPLTINENQVYLEAGANSVPVTYQIAADLREVTLTPVEPMQPYNRYQLHVRYVETLTGHTIYDRSVTQFDTGGTADTTPPQVVSLSPPEGTTDVPLDARIRLRFDEPVTWENTGPPLTLAGPAGNVGGSWELDAYRQLLTFSPEALQAGASYTVTTAAITDRAGNELAPLSWHFTTATADDETNPYVVSVSPAYAAVDVAVDTPIVLTFDGIIDPTSIDAETIRIRTSGINLAGSFEVTANVVTFTPIPARLRVPPANARIEIYVTNQVYDLAGNRATTFSSFYTTADDVDTTPPRVISISPSDGTEGVDPSQDITLVFSESLDSNRINTNNILLFADGNRISSSVSRSADNRTVTLASNYLDASQAIDVVLTQELQDLSGNPLEPFHSTYHTGSRSDRVRPRVTSQQPARGASSVEPPSSVVLFADEALDPDSLIDQVILVIDGVVAGSSLQLRGEGRILEVLPVNPLPYDSLIQVFVTDRVHDLVGNALYAYDGQFTTKTDPATTRPYLIDRSPRQSTIPRNPVFELAYSEPLDAATVNETTIVFSERFGSVVSRTVELIDDRIIRITPVITLSPSTTYTLTISSGTVFDQHGDSAQSFSISWTTGDASDSLPPLLAFTSPLDTFVGAPVNVLPRLRFNEPINPVSLFSLTLTPNGATPQALDWDISDEEREVALQPRAPLLPSTEYTLSMQIKDLAGNALAETSLSFTTSSTLDTTKPRILQVSPLGGDANVPLNVIPGILADEPLDPGSFRSGRFQLYDETENTYVTGSFSLDQTSTRAWFHPDTALQPNHEFSLTVSHLLDLAGNQAQNSFSHRFFTGVDQDSQPPVILGISIEEGETQLPLNLEPGVLIDEVISGQNLEGVTLRAGGSDHPVIPLLQSAGRHLQLHPTPLLDPLTTYTLTIAGVVDLAGNLQKGQITRQFTTGEQVDVIRPSIETTVPPQSATDVATNIVIEISFSERLNPFTLDEASFYLERTTNGTERITGTIALDEEGRTATFQPDTPLDNASNYRFRLQSSISDRSGNLLSYHYTGYFTTR